MVLETLDEKQIHLVKPVMPKLVRLLGKVTSSASLNLEEPLHYSWLLVCYE